MCNLVYGKLCIQPRWYGSRVPYVFLCIMPSRVSREVMVSAIRAGVAWCGYVTAL